ncbi:Periplasmic pH-dependent serine endoprotease DegQ [Thalassocella blandensis]|nr:Periplasmic pH-dependent serine endoprotease DegQ [Thalassocella blandensis]
MQLKHTFTALFLSFFLTGTANAALPAFDASGNQLPSLSPMLKKVNPAVVNIATYSNHQAAQNPLLNDPFFRRFFNIPDQPQQQQPQRRQQSAGSGVIVDAKKGIVMTNYHVIKGADEVQVALEDGRNFEAKVKGSDPELDIAILEIDADNLVDVKLSNSDELEVGDFVVAIGNPFGLGQTVTTGIVSALGRTGLGIEGYENFIQTDASINPGNSGGALVNLRGELIGINTAIIAPAGGNVGIGFAIPINMAESSLRQILKHGEVKRGQIGVSIQDITSDLRKAFGLENGQQGVLITDVLEGTPAEKAGLKAGDVIVDVDGADTSSAGQLRSQIGIKSVGEKVKVGVIRDNKRREFDVKIGDSEVASDGNLHPLLEDVVAENNPDGEGVLISNVGPNSVAAYSGLRPGDIVIGVNKRRVDNLKDMQKALSMNKTAVLLHINRRGRSLYLVIR